MHVRKARESSSPRQLFVATPTILLRAELEPFTLTIQQLDYFCPLFTKIARLISESPQRNESERVWNVLDAEASDK